MQDFLIITARELAKSAVAIFLLLCLIQFAVWITGYHLVGGVFSRGGIAAATMIYAVCSLLNLFVNIDWNISFSKGEK